MTNRFLIVAIKKLNCLQFQFRRKEFFLGVNTFLWGFALGFLLMILTLIPVPFGRCLSTLPPNVFGLKLYWNASKTLLPRALFVLETINKMMATSSIMMVVKTTITTPIKFSSEGSWSMGLGAITVTKRKIERDKIKSFHELMKCTRLWE